MKKLFFALIAILISTGTTAAKEIVLWQTGETAKEGDGTVKEAYSTGLIIAPEKFADIKAGSQINIRLKATSWVELYLKNYDKAQIYPSTTVNNGLATQILTNFQLEQIKNGGFRIDGSGPLEITQVTVDTDTYQGNFENAIWIGRQTFTADWGGIVMFSPLQASELSDYDQFKVYYTKNAESTSVMVNYINTENKQIDYYPEWTYNEAGASFTIAPDFIEFLKNNNKGFVVKGASITVSQIDHIKINSGISDIVTNQNTTDNVNVYNANGILLYKNVCADEVVKKLPAGFYIIGQKKYIIK